MQKSRGVHRLFGIALVLMLFVVVLGGIQPVRANVQLGVEKAIQQKDGDGEWPQEQDEESDQIERSELLKTLQREVTWQKIRQQEKQSVREDFLAESIRTITADITADVFSSCTEVTDVSQEECEALVELYNSSGGSDWNHNNKWLVLDQVCSWYGIDCAGGHVISIALPSNNVVGPLTADFSAFPSLSYFDLDDNLLAMDIGNILVKLPTGLTNLYLGSNGLTGNIPIGISSFSSLDILDVGRNQLTGDMSTLITKLPTGLEELWLNGNNFTGTIPEHLTDFNNLIWLDISDNLLSGNIATFLGYLPTGLVYLGLNQNQFSGTIPSTLSSFTDLQFLNVGFNQLSGDLSSIIGDLPAGLEQLNLESNLITGTISTEVSKFSGLLELALGGNQLNGIFTNIVDDLPTSLTNLSLYANEFTGTVPSEISLLNSLITLDLADNLLEGNLTTIIGYLPTSIQYLYLNRNDFTGTIPSAISDLTGLKTLDAGYNFLNGDLTAIIGYLPTGVVNLILDWNNLTGTIPSTIATLTSLEGLDLGGNALIGDLGTIIGYLPTGMQYLRLDWNSLDGTIPAAIGDLTALTDLDLGGNALTGNMGTIIGYLPLGMDYLRLDSNNFSGTIPAQIADLYLLTRLDVGMNNLDGSLTDIIGYLPTGLLSLYLESNNFTGTIPSSIANLTNLWTLDVSNNQNLTGDLGTIIGYLPDKLTTLYLGSNAFTGTIPASISDLTNLTRLNVSQNVGLDGLIPIEITNLSLILFDFSDTYLCEPSDPAYSAWKATVSDYYSGLCSLGTEVLTNNSFETYIPAGWQDGRQIEPYDGPDCGTGNDRTGNCAVHFEGDGTSKRIFMRYKLAGVAGDNFMLTLYRKGASVPAADGAFVKATFFYTDGTQEVFKVNLDTGTIGTWEQFTLPFTAAKNYKRVNLDLFYKKASGTMWLDDISLKRNGGAELLENTSFEIYKPDDYILSVNLTSNEGPDCSGSNAHSDTCSVHFDGDGNNKRLLMRAKKAGSSGDPVTISIWRKGVSVPAAGGAYVKVEVFYTDGTSDIVKMDLDVGNLAVWEQISTTFSVAKDYKRFNVDLFYKKASGTLWLDDFSLLVP